MMKLPKPDITYAVSKSDMLTERGLKGILCNPIYAGIPPFPATIGDEEWISAAKKLIEEDGAEQFLVNMLYVLRKSMQAAWEGRE